jgi:pyruvate dehydrogenase E1 component
MLYYKEARNGQLLEEGITEAGALSSWVAAATSYSVHGQAMLPFYIYYSMFGFQRVGDLIWAAADQRARGFLLGATAGRTTLGGEGLQHQDGTSHVMAATIPNCRAYDPAFAHELAVIIDHGMREMMEQQNDVFYYVTVMNENYPQPGFPAKVEADIVKGMYHFAQVGEPGAEKRVQLLGSGAILREAIEAATLLWQDFEIASDVFSVTSFSELSKDARAVERHNRFHPDDLVQKSHVETLLTPGIPVIAATDYVRAVPQLIAPFIEGRFITLGTDGFGRSDTRAALRSFFEVDRHHIALAAIDALVRNGSLPRSTLAESLARYGIDTDRPAPWSC